MVDGVQIKVDARAARLKLDRVTPTVRDALRAVLPNLTKQLASAVTSKLGSELKSMKTLTVTQELRESTNQIYGLVSLKSPSAGGLLPTYLEEGTRPHEIVGNPFLAFHWERLGVDVVFRRVQHPGTKAYQFMARSFAEQRDEIVSQISEAAKSGAQKAR
jgi:hypothetical protein